MIASFFQSLETHRVAYLLISGQATVLYGAATFSEDIDLWVEPSSGNLERFQAALSAVGARYYKLTPPLEAPYFEAGHGFHFFLGPGESETIFLDVLGRPPRAPSFAAALRERREFATDWGALPTVGIRDLIELKKTQRLADYPIVSALTLRLLEESAPSLETLAWAAGNLFTAEAFFSFNEKYPAWIELPPPDAPPSLTQIAGRGIEHVPDETIADATRWMAGTMARHQVADRRHWGGIIAQLRHLRSNRILMTEGAPV